jgi:hypothetical protein
VTESVTQQPRLSDTERYSYDALSGWLVTCGACLLFLIFLYKKATSHG